MTIDEEKKFILTNYEQIRKGGKVSDTDHATEILDVKLSVKNEKPEIRELFNFKNSEAQRKFKQETTNTKDFTKCFTNDLPLEHQIENFREVLNKKCSKSFKKIRIKNKRKYDPINSQISHLITIRNSLLSKNESKYQLQVDQLNEKISELEANDNREKILKHFKRISEDPEKVNLSQMWKNLKKIWPKTGTNLPSAKRNHQGKIITDPHSLKLLLAKEYRERLRSRPIRPDLKQLEVYKKTISDIKMKIASLRKSSDWTISELEKALKCLKINKSRDHEGFINEIFKQEVIGTDLKNSLLILFNKLKKNKRFQNS